MSLVSSILYDYHVYLSTCRTLILRLIQCKWNFLALLCRTQVSVGEKRVVAKRKFTAIYNTSYTFPYLIFITVGRIVMVQEHFIDYRVLNVGGRVENTVHVNTLAGLS